jgi:hypothetical protein
LWVGCLVTEAGLTPVRSPCGGCFAPSIAVGRAVPSRRCARHSLRACCIVIKRRQERNSGARVRHARSDH